MQVSKPLVWWHNIIILEDIMDETARKKMWADYARTKQADIREKIILEYAPLVKVVAGRLSMYQIGRAHV